MVNACFKRCRLSSFAFGINFRLVKSFWSSFLKLLILLGLAISFNSIVVVAAEASTCQQLNHHEICLVKLKRSAKYYWEYRAVISVDGQKQPLEIYNCRDRLHTNRYKNIVPFRDDGVGKLVCRLYAKLR